MHLNLVFAIAIEKVQIEAISGLDAIGAIGAVLPWFDIAPVLTRPLLRTDANSSWAGRPNWGLNSRSTRRPCLGHLISSAPGRAAYGDQRRISNLLLLANRYLLMSG